VIASGIAAQQVGVRCFGRAFLHGYAVRMRSRVDIASIRAWQEGLEFPSDAEESQFIDPSTWPESVRELSPNVVWLVVPPEEGVELSWGSGHVGHWGVGVGPRGMPTPTGNEHRQMLPLADGAFVWYD
jgi:hypothetical protein